MEYSMKFRQFFSINAFLQPHQFLFFHSSKFYYFIHFFFPFQLLCGFLFIFFRVF